MQAGRPGLAAQLLRRKPIGQMVQEAESGHGGTRLVRSFGVVQLTMISVGATLGTGCVLIASMLVSSAVTHRLVIHELLIAAFLTMTAPVTAILLMRAARSRSRKD